MGFTLTISEGTDRGREYTFSQPEVCIGRTAENDVVLSDAGVSRRHVMIRDEGGRYVVQDLGSANGTKVNGEPVTEDEVRDGDLIHVGPVIFAFAAVPEAGGATRIFDPAEIEKKMLATKKAKEQATKEAGPQKRAVTAMAPAIARPTSAKGRPNSGKVEPAAGAGSSNRALSKKAPAPSKDLAPASARARARREAKTPLAKFKLFWSEATPGKRIAVAGGGAILVLGLLFAATRGKKGEVFVDNSDHSRQTYPLLPEPSDETYGYPDAKNSTLDKAQFDFSFPVTGKKATVTLHFMSGAIAKPEEVDVMVNTYHVGFANPGLGDNMRPQSIDIPWKYLKANDKNHVVFDNLKNPPGQEPWLIGKIWVEIQQLPEDRPERLKARAQEAIVRADKLYDQRQIGAENLYGAWKGYREAKLYLEALSEKIDEYDVVRQKIKDCERDLDAECAKQLFNGQRAEQLKHYDEALKIYQNALRFFPDKDHACNGMLRDKMQNLE